jgi:hypothetical protein
MWAYFGEMFIFGLLCMNRIIDTPVLDGALVLALILGIEGVILALYLDRQSIKLGFVCPHCHKPLYQPRSKILETGLCPHCNYSVT